MVSTFDLHFDLSFLIKHLNTSTRNQDRQPRHTAIVTMIDADKHGTEWAKPVYKRHAIDIPQMLPEAATASKCSCHGHAGQACTLWHQQPCPENQQQCLTAREQLPDAAGTHRALRRAAGKANKPLLIRTRHMHARIDIAFSFCN